MGDADAECHCPAPPDHRPDCAAVEEIRRLETSIRERITGVHDCNAVALLRELEWSGGENRLHLCPCCDHDKLGTHRVGSVFAADEGHAANCRLAILIGAPRRER